MGRKAIHRYCTPGISDRQSATYHRSKLLGCVGTSLELKRHIDDITRGFVSSQAKAAILRWKMATEDAKPYIEDRGEE